MKASFTVEAAFLLPLIIVLTAWMIQLTIGLYESVSETAENITLVTELDAVSMFRERMLASDLLGHALD